MEQYGHLSEVKELLGITGTYQDKTLNLYALETIEYMVSAGVTPEIASSEKAIGVVARGISDLWNYGSGNTQLSQYFKERVIQLSLEGGSHTPTHESCVEPIKEEEIKKIIEEVL